MKKIWTLSLLLLLVTGSSTIAQDAAKIIENVDKNMTSTNREFESTMTIQGKRTTRSISSHSYSVGTNKSFTEYLSPASERGTKMLKVDKQLWIYSPATDRTINISGHLLRQSVMGSDLSYEDMMEDRKLTDVYDATISGEETLGDRACWIIQLKSKVEDIAYHSQKMWIDQERYVPLKQELYAKSGQLLKQIQMADVKRIGNRWFPMTVTYKDMLKEGKGTEFRMTSIKFDQEIPDYIFTKAALKQ